MYLFSTDALFFPDTFILWLVKSKDVEPVVTESRPWIRFTSSTELSPTDPHSCRSDPLSAVLPVLVTHMRVFTWNAEALDKLTLCCAHLSCSSDMELLMASGHVLSLLFLLLLSGSPFLASSLACEHPRPAAGPSPCCACCGLRASGVTSYVVPPSSSYFFLCSSADYNVLEGREILGG